MKKILLCMSVLLSFVCVFAFSQEAHAAKKQYAYKNTYWGDSIKTVKKVYKKELLIDETEDKLVYETETYDLYSYTIFEFDKGKLYAVVVNFDLNETSLDDDDKYTLYGGLRVLTKKSLKTKSRGEYTYDDDGYYNRWVMKSRFVYLGVYDKDDGETMASVIYVDKNHDLE